MPKNKLAYTRQAKGETLYQIFQRTGFRVAHLSDIERSFALPTLDETVQLAEIYDMPRSEVVKITNAGWEGNDIKAKVEEMVSLIAKADVALDMHDNITFNKLNTEGSNIEQQLLNDNIALLEDQENVGILHVYINGERWKDFEVFKKQWIDIEENNVNRT
jgi:hypothetical protein